MNFILQIDRFKHLHHLLEKECTGNADLLAKTLGIQRRQLFNIFESMKLMGVDIGYDKLQETYFYKGNKYLDVHFTIKELNVDELKNTNGGHCFLSQCNKVALTLC